MKYLPGAVANADLPIAQAPYFGGEFAVYMTQVGAVHLGDVVFSGPGAAVWQPNVSAAMNGGSGGGDLQMVARTAINSTVACGVVLAALDNSGSPVAVTGTGSFTPPARASNQTFNFERGVATDLTLNPKVTHSTTRARATNVATIVSPAHGYTTGQHVTTTLFGGSGYNVVNVAITVVDPNTFTYASTGSDETTAADVTGTITPVGIGTKFTGITGLTSVTGGGINQIIGVFQLPEAADYSLIEPSTEIDFNTKARMAKGIDSGMEADAYVKRGKTNPGDLTIGSKFKEFSESMTRFAGQRCTAMLVGIKEGQVTDERLVFTQYVATVRPKLPDGDGEATVESTGKYVDHLFFVAP